MSTKTKAVKRKARLSLTKLEAEALEATALDMKDDIDDYFGYMPKKELKQFRKAYETAMDKLREAIRELS